jgi:hypothetical protein
MATTASTPPPLPEKTTTTPEQILILELSNRYRTGIYLYSWAKTAADPVPDLVIQGFEKV